MASPRRWPQAARADLGEQGLHHVAQLLRIAAAGIDRAPAQVPAKVKADDLDVFHQQQVGRDGRHLPAGKANEQNAALRAHGVQGLLELRAAHGVKHQVGAFAIGQCLDLCGQGVCLVSVAHQRVVGAMGPHQFAALGRARDRNHAGTSQPGNFHGGHAHATGGAQHHHGLTGSQSAAPVQRGMGGAVGGGHQCGGIQGHGRWHMPHGFSGGHRLFTKAAPVQGRHHSVAGRKARHVGRHLQHGAADLGARHKGQRGLALVAPAGLQKQRIAHAGIGHGNAHTTCPQRRGRYIRQAQTPPAGPGFAQQRPHAAPCKRIKRLPMLLPA